MDRPAASGFGKTQYVSNNNSEAQLLINLLEDSGIKVESSCAGVGTCGKCRVQIVNGECSLAGPEELDLLSREDIENGIRLACYCQVSGEVALRIEEVANNVRILETALLSNFELRPVVRKEFLPSMQHNQGYSLAEQVLSRLKSTFDDISRLDLLRLMGENERAEDLTAILHASNLVGLESGDTRDYRYGVAFDIGTTTVVAALYDLNSGAEMAVVSALNPQSSCGLDVLSRIQYAGKGSAGLIKLRDMLLSCLNQLIDELSLLRGVNKLHIYEVSAAGNTVMEHLLLGVNPASIGHAPYCPVFRQGQSINAVRADLFVSPFAHLYCLPSVSGFIGGDIVAGIAATELDKEAGNLLFIDLGTNGEIVLCAGGKLIACSTAAGPALEGMNIACGMRAASGAIEEVWFKDGSLSWKTIDNSEARGLCGSGLMDLVAAMLGSGLINQAGRIAKKDEYVRAFPKSLLGQQLHEIEGKKRFWLIPPRQDGKNGVYISQTDVRQVQLAKSAIATGIKTLLIQAGLGEGDISRVYLAGAFGACLRPESLIRLGFFPEAWTKHITFVGNTAKSGAAMALLSGPARQRMEDIARKVDYIRLESYPGFEKYFVRNMGFAV